MGLQYDGNDVSFTSRARVTFTLSGQTDGGLAFGGSFRADNAGAAARGTAGSVFVESDFGKLSMGDVAGAARAAVGDLHGVGLTGLGDLNEMAYIDRALGDISQAFDAIAALADIPVFGVLPRAQYSYSIDGFSVFASVDNPVMIRDADDNKEFSVRNVAIGASYSAEGFTVAAGYEDARIKDHDASETITARHLIASAQYDFDGFSVKGIAGRVSGDLGDALKDTSGLRRDQYGLSVSGTFDATTVSAFGHRNFATTDYGIGISHDLGGGARIVGGIVQSGKNSTLEIKSNTTADLGLSFSF